MAITVENPDGETLYYQPARGNGKSLLSFVNACRERGTTDEEIKELFEQAIRNMEG